MALEFVEVDAGGPGRESSEQGAGGQGQPGLRQAEGMRHFRLAPPAVAEDDDPPGPDDGPKGDHPGDGVPPDEEDPIARGQAVTGEVPGRAGCHLDGLVEAESPTALHEVIPAGPATAGRQQRVQAAGAGFVHEEGDAVVAPYEAITPTVGHRGHRTTIGIRQLLFLSSGAESPYPILSQDSS